MNHKMIKDNHLGGFVDGGDFRCFYPEMWDVIIKDFKIKTVIDIGCGQGHALEYFKSKGLDGLGIDGSKKVLSHAVFSPIIIHDYTTGSYMPEQVFDFAWCNEFVEHVEDQYIDHFLTTFAMAKVLAVSHALPGQDGYHHVNCKDDAYWIDKIVNAGFLFKLEETKKYRALAHDYFQQSGLIFINNYL